MPGYSDSAVSRSGWKWVAVFTRFGNGLAFYWWWVAGVLSLLMAIRLRIALYDGDTGVDSALVEANSLLLIVYGAASLFSAICGNRLSKRLKLVEVPAGSPPSSTACVNFRRAMWQFKAATVVAALGSIASLFVQLSRWQAAALALATLYALTIGISRAYIAYRRVLRLQAAG